MPDRPDMPYDFSKLMELANSPAGKRLMELVRQKSGENLSAAIKNAQAGDISDAKQIIGSVLATPEAKKLINELEGRK